MGGRASNDPRQYDDLAGEVVASQRRFLDAALVGEARDGWFPPADRPGAVLADLGCGAACFRRTCREGYRHVGIDLTRSLSIRRPTTV